MVKVGRISKNAGALLRKVVDGMPVAELKDYKDHCGGKGYPIRKLSEIEAAMELADAGFLLRKPSLTDPHPIYLSQTGWDRFQIAEWSEIQRVIDIEKSGPDFGSW